jgi:hypothetical protein
VAALQADGTCWAGSTVWQGRTAMRISVSNWSTTDADVDRSLAGDAAGGGQAVERARVERDDVERFYALRFTLYGPLRVRVEGVVLGRLG